MVGEGVTIQVPNAIHRLRIKGPGVRYVHGGASLPEIVVPIVHISKGRSASEDVRKVSFRIQQTTDRITTGQITVDFLQTEPVGGKVSERTVLAGLWGVSADGKGVLISNEVPIAFNSTSKDSADRHIPAGRRCRPIQQHNRRIACERADSRLQPDASAGREGGVSAQARLVHR